MRKFLQTFFIRKFMCWCRVIITIIDFYLMKHVFNYLTSMTFKCQKNCNKSISFWNFNFNLHTDVPRIGKNYFRHQTLCINTPWTNQYMYIYYIEAGAPTILTRIDAQFQLQRYEVGGHSWHRLAAVDDAEVEAIIIKKE